MPGVEHMIPKLQKWTLNLRLEPEGPLRVAQVAPFSDVECELGGMTSVEAEPGLDVGLLTPAFGLCASVCLLGRRGWEAEEGQSWKF